MFVDHWVDHKGGRSSDYPILRYLFRYRCRSSNCIGRSFREFKSKPIASSLKNGTGPPAYTMYVAWRAGARQRYVSVDYIHKSGTKTLATGRNLSVLKIELCTNRPLRPHKNLRRLRSYKIKPPSLQSTYVSQQSALS